MSSFLERAYGTRLRLSARADVRLAGTPSLVHTRLDIGPVTIDKIRQRGHVRLSADPSDKVIVVWATRGRMTSHCNGLAATAAAGEIAIPAQHDLPSRAEMHDLHQTSVVMQRSLLARVAAEQLGGETWLPIHFSSFAPKDAAARRLWQNAFKHVRMLLSDNSIATPLVLGHTSRMLAAVTLAVFPNTAIAAPRPVDRTDHQPVLLRRAMEFIEANVDNDIALIDIAMAVHVTPRALQYMFRRHLDTTPTQYARRVRLHHTHRDLLAGVRPCDTVTAIAARWGFLHTGRFAALYRQMYGQSPHATLRGDDGICPWLQTGS